MTPPRSSAATARSTSSTRARLLQLAVRGDGLLLELLLERGELSGKLAVTERENLGGQDRGVLRASGADGDGRDRHALRHLHGRQQRIETIEARGIERDTDHRQRRLGGDGAREVRRAPGTADENLDAALGAACGISGGSLGRAVSGEDVDIARDSERLEPSGGRRHGLPVAVAAHQDRHLRFCLHASTTSRALALRYPVCTAYPATGSCPPRCRRWRRR